MRQKITESEKTKKLISDARLIWKPALITIGVIAVLLVIILLSVSMSSREPVSKFLARWEKIVESGDQKAYDEICSKDFKEKFRNLHGEVKGMIAAQDVDVRMEDAKIEKTRVDNNYYVIDHIPVSLSRADVQTRQELDFKLDVKREGLIKREWKVALAEYDFVKMEEEALEQVVASVTAAEEEIANLPPEPEKAPLDTDIRVRQTLEVWRTAWNGKELDKYMDCYADYADITRVTVVDGKEQRAKLTKSELRNHIARLNKKYSKILVEITDLEIEGDVATAEANFLQEYSSWRTSEVAPVYHDLGTKELQFVKHDVEWKIANENWTLYKEVPIYRKREY
jgi:ketosteroid isomerase-like protein